MPRRVIILTTESPEKGGGVEHLVRELSSALQSRGYSVEVLHKDNCLPPALRSSRSQLSRYWADATLGWYQLKKLKETWSGEVAAVISQSTAGIWTLRPRDSSAKFFHFYHGTYRGQAEAIRPFISLSGYWKMKWWDAMVLERLAGRHKLILCASDFVREEVRRFFGYEGKTVWYPLDVEQFRPMDRFESRRKLNLPEDRPIALFVGSTQPTKGFPLVRALIPALPDVHWVLAIRGEIPQELSTDPRVHVFQNADHSTMPLLYAVADFTVCPSRYDAFPYAVSESLACGTPVIASPNGASQFFFSAAPLDQLLVPRADDLDGFAAAAGKVIREPEFFRRAVMEFARPKVLEAMSPENWLARFCEITGL
jgi:glycosyltransferase involved in cell wall biosynthesis